MGTMVFKINPDMEAFFLATMLELGTRPGEVSTTQNNEEGWNRVVHYSEVKKYMMAHPGAPLQVERVVRALKEVGGGLKADMNDDYFWNKLVEAYFAWCAQQPGA